MGLVVPMSSGTKPSPSQPMPSQADLLMALAEMHKQGRFNPPPEPK